MSKICLQNVEKFNKPINKWNIINVINMNNMFYNCVRFQQPIEKWNWKMLINEN